MSFLSDAHSAEKLLIKGLISALKTRPFNSTLLKRYSFKKRGIHIRVLYVRERFITNTNALTHTIY